MGSLITDFLVMGKVPGTEQVINFEAFLQGLVVGGAILLSYRLLASKLTNRQN